MNGNLAREAAHLAHVLLVMHRDDDRAGAKEQQRLEEGVGEEMEDAERIAADAERDEHVAELRAGRIGDDALDVVLHEADGRREKGRRAADEGDEGERGGRLLEQRREPRHHEDAGGHHGRRVDQGGDGRRALHRVRQPGVEQELRRFAHRAHEQQEAGDRHRVQVGAEDVNRRMRKSRRGGENLVEADRTGQLENEEDAEQEAEVADAVDDEGLDRGGVGGGLLVPESDQQVRGEADAFPTEEHLQKIVGGDQRQHGEGKEREKGEEPRGFPIP